MFINKKWVFVIKNLFEIIFFKANNNLSLTPLCFLLKFLCGDCWLLLPRT